VTSVRGWVTWCSAQAEVLDVAAEADAVDATQITVALSYRVRRTNTRESLVFPFYLVRGATP
jgi:hypothetical protein